MMVDGAANDTVDYDGSDLEALTILKNYQNWIFARVAPWLGGTAAELGAGIGSFSAMFARNVISLDAIEPSTALQARLTSAVSELGNVRVLAQSAEGWLADVAPQHYDCVVMINVLEHIRDDAAVLKGIYDALKPGGRLIVFVPALQFLFSNIDRQVGHFRRYERSALTSVLAGAGFRIADMRFFDMLGILPWLVMNTWLGKTEFNPGLVGLYDRIGVPLTRELESLIAPPIGKNLIAVSIKE
jgi:SAM-dependent methyltransferase